MRIVRIGKDYAYVDGQGNVKGILKPFDRRIQALDGSERYIYHPSIKNGCTVVPRKFREMGD